MYSSDEYRQSYFGHILVSPDQFRSNPVDPEWFEREVDRHAVSVLRDMDEAGPVDPIAFASAMGNEGKRYLKMVACDYAVVLTLGQAVEGIRTGYKRRTLREIGRALAQGSMDDMEAPESLSLIHI